jgi:hypothetical protein
MDDLLSHNHSQSGPDGGTVMWIGLIAVVVIFFGAILLASHKSDKSGIGGTPKVKVQTLSTNDANINAGRDAPTALMRGQYYRVVEMEEPD